MTYLTLAVLSVVPDCRAVCHPDCKDQLPLPCVPCGDTPGSGKKRPVCIPNIHFRQLVVWLLLLLLLFLLTVYCLFLLQDENIEFYAPSTSPMVPEIVVSKLCLCVVQTLLVASLGYFVPFLYTSEGTRLLKSKGYTLNRLLFPGYLLLIN